MENDLFTDLIVVELASVLAGPAVGLFFSELGAKVIKIENSTTHGDVTRKWRLSDEDQNRPYSAYYCSVNWNKETHFKNLRDAVDLKFVYKLIEKADIVISNFKKKSAILMGLDYKTLKKINPKIIYGQINAYEYLDKPAFDVILQAETGFLSMTGEKDGGFVKMPVALIDVIAAHQLKEGLLIALLKKYKTDKGSYVETSLESSAIASLVNQASNYLMEAHIPEKMGVEHPNIVPYGTVFYSKDSVAMVIGAGTDKQFDVLCECLDAKHLPLNDKFKSNKFRVQNRINLNNILKEKFLNFNFDEIYCKLVEKNVPVGKVISVKDVFNGDVGKEMILEEMMIDGKLSRRVKSVSFNITD